MCVCVGSIEILIRNVERLYDVSVAVIYLLESNNCVSQLLNFSFKFARRYYYGREVTLVIRLFRIA